MKREGLSWLWGRISSCEEREGLPWLSGKNITWKKVNVSSCRELYAALPPGRLITSFMSVNSLLTPSIILWRNQGHNAELVFLIWSRKKLSRIRMWYYISVNFQSIMDKIVLIYHIFTRTIFPATKSRKFCFMSLIPL